MRLTTALTNFSRGQIDHNLQGRFDLPIYNTGSERFINFVSNFQGNAIFRCGLLHMLDLFDCNMVEFRFNFEQNYILLFCDPTNSGTAKIRFLTFDSNGNFGFVLSGGSPLEVATPYTLAQAKQIQTAQDADVMYVVHPLFKPYKLTRTSATSFTFSAVSLIDGGYLAINSTATTITPSGTTGSITLTASASLFAASDVGRLVRIKIGSNWSWGEITAFTSATVVSFTVKGAALGGTTATTDWRLGAFYANNYPSAVSFHKGRLYLGATNSKITSVWGSKVGDYENFGTSGTIVDDDGLFFTVSDLSERISWIASGSNSLLLGSSEGIVTVNGGDSSEPITATAINASKVVDDGANSTIPVRKDGLVFYIGARGRNVYSFSYDLLSERFKASDLNVISYDITKGGISQIKRVKTRNDLFYMVNGNGGLVSLNFNEAEQIVGWHEHNTEGAIQQIVSITDNDGNAKLFALVVRNSVYYLEMLAENVDFNLRSDFYTGDADADKEAYSRYTAELLKDCIYLDNSEVVDRLQSNAITFDPDALTITATSNVFAADDVGHEIVYQSATGYERGRFKIESYTSAKVVGVSVILAPSSNTYTNWFLTFSEISGLTRFANKTVSVVADGGYLKEFAVDGSGDFSLGVEATRIVVGYPYIGEIKSMNLGFSFQGENTQITSKNIYQVTARFNFSAGGFLGSSKYEMQEVQLYDTSGYYGLPPLPMDGDYSIGYNDATSKDKRIYIQQKLPLPMEVCALFIDAKYENKL